MTTYYCDLGNDFDNPANVGDAAGNPALGPGGLLSMIQGWGNHDKQAAGDLLYVKGTGDVSKLVKITVDVDKSGTWNISDAVQNHNDGGGASGDDWVGELVYIDATTLWVQINDASSDYASVDITDGVDKTGGGADTIPGANMTAKAAPGIDLSNTSNEGSEAAGYIRVVGTTNLASAAGNLGQFVLDANGVGTNCMGANSRKGWSWEYCTVQNAVAANVNWDTAGFSDVWMWIRCKNLNAGTYAFEGPGRYMFLERTVVRAAGSGCSNRSDIGWKLWLSEVSGCTGDGPRGTATIVVDCLVFENTGDNVYSLAGGFICHIVSDGAGSDGVFLNSSNVPGHVVSSRLTNNTAQGIIGYATNKLQYQNWNVFHGNGGTTLNITDGLDSDTVPADDGYVNAAADDYNVKDGAEYDSEGLVVNL